MSVTSDHVTDEDHVTSDRTSGRRMCGADAQYSDVEQIRSETSTLYVKFRSNDVFDATGFEATYQFYSPVQGTATARQGLTNITASAYRILSALQTYVITYCLTV